MVIDELMSWWWNGSGVGGVGGRAKKIAVLLVV